MLLILGHIFLFRYMSVTFLLNARCAGYPFTASVKMVWGLVNISPWPDGMSEGGMVQKRGVSSHASCSRLLPALLLQRSGPGQRGGSGVFSTGRLWSPLPPALGPYGAHVLQGLALSTHFPPCSAMGSSAFLPVPGFCCDGHNS